MTSENIRFLSHVILRWYGLEVNLGGIIDVGSGVNPTRFGFSSPNETINRSVYRATIQDVKFFVHLGRKAFQNQRNNFEGYWQICQSILSLWPSHITNSRNDNYLFAPNTNIHHDNSSNARLSGKNSVDGWTTVNRGTSKAKTCSHLNIKVVVIFFGQIDENGEKGQHWVLVEESAFGPDHHQREDSQTKS